MAKNSTIYKANISISDSVNDYYADHQLTLACHPSETEERMMLRILAFALDADEMLVPAGGISVSEEPDLWLKDYTGDIKLWVELGQPDEKRMLKACGRSELVKIYTYGTKPELWWSSVEPKVAKAKNLSVYSVDSASSKGLTSLAKRTMDLQISIDDEEIWMRDDENSVCVNISKLR